MRFPVFAPSLRAQMLLVVLAALIPLGLAGLWVTRAAQRAGEDLLRARLQESILDVSVAVGTNWVRHRARLLDVADSETVRRALAGDSAGAPVVYQLDDRGIEPAAEPLQAAWSRLDGAALDVSVRDPAGVLRTVVRAQPRDPDVIATLPVRLPIRSRASGRHLGTLETRLRLESLLADATWWAGIGGAVLGIFEPGTERSLLPTPVDPGLLVRLEFQRDGERWLAERRTLREPPLQLALAAPVTPFQEPALSAARQGTLALAAALGIALLLAALLVRWTSRSLTEVAGAADAVSAGDLARSVPVAGPAEVRRLASAFNTMTANLRRTLAELSGREALAAVGEFAASLAHEIRNPLTAARVDLQRAARAATGDEARLIDRALEQLDGLDTTVATALRLARSGSVHLAPLDLREPLLGAVRAESRAVEAAGGVLEVGPMPSPVPVRGDLDALARLFGNVLGNAAQAISQGGRVDVALEEREADVLVRIRDDGAGVPPADRARVFEVLFSTRPGGTGLGLPIARRIAEAHGGSVELESGHARGVTVLVRLPRATRSHGAASTVTNPDSDRSDP